MRGGTIALAFLVALLLAPWAAQAQSPELQGAFERAQSLHSRGRYEEAMSVAQDAVLLSERELGSDHLATGTVLNILAQLCNARAATADLSC